MQVLAQSGLVLACCLIAGGGMRPSSQSLARGDPEDRIASIVEGALRQAEVEGLSIAIAIGSDVLLERGWGSAPDGSRADEESLYGVGSLLEPWIRVATLKVLDEADAGLGDAVNKFFPALEGHPDVRLEHLMGHRSGLPDYTDWVDGKMVREEVLARLAESPLEFEPDACLEFSRTNTLLLGWLLEDLTSESIPDVLQRYVFDPAGMECTGYEAESPPFRSIAQSVQEFAGSLEWGPSGPAPFHAHELHACVRDIMAWQRALLDRQLLGERSTSRMITPSVLTNHSTTNHAYGLNHSSLGEYDYMSHGGGLGGYRVHAAYYPRLDLSLVLMATGQDAPLVRDGRRIVRAIFDLPEPGVDTRPLAGEDGEKYVGRYNIGCNHVSISLEEDHLIFEGVDFDRLVLHYQGRNGFIADLDPEVRIVFRIEDGSAASFMLEQHGTRMEAVRFD